MCRIVLLAAALFLSLNLVLPTTFASIRISLVMQPSVAVTAPPVILQPGTAGNSTIYTNSTSAKVSVASDITYDYVLRVNDTFTDSWQVRLKKYSDSNTNRLQNCTIYFHNATNANSTQIVIENGSFNQTEGSWCTLTSLETIYIALTVEANSTGTSYVHVYLEVLIPTTTTYAQYVILFEIT